MSDSKSVLIARHGAYGDCIHVSHLPQLLKENGYSIVGVSTGKKGLNIFYGNPYIDKIHYCELMENTKHLGKHFYSGRLAEIGRNYDRVIDLNQAIEVNALPGQYQNEYYQDFGTRAKMGKENYYDIATKIAGFHHLIGKYKGQIHFTKSEDAMVNNGMLKYSNNFKIMVNLMGTSPHKVFIQAKEVIQKVLDKYPESIVFTTGNKDAKEFDVELPRVKSIVGKFHFRQALNMCKYMDCVIGCESGLMCGASALGVPTIQLMTAASIENHCKYAEKDYSIQSPCRCSPCHRNPYDYWGCPRTNGMPRCIYFDIDVIMEQINKVHELCSSQITI